MFEENDIKWVRVPDRGSKRSSPHCITNRGEEGNSRHRSSRSEGSRSNSHEDRGRHYTRRERSPLRSVREDVFEEGGIKKGASDRPLTVSLTEGKKETQGIEVLDRKDPGVTLTRIEVDTTQEERGALYAQFVRMFLKKGGSRVTRRARSVLLERRRRR
ncbi:hypothetical protein F2Q69_00042439 [Brassica cretica]|uniref:Uncharacterized protein n=1 Tax=Brassica cretica TaxID=69181 RepID=A0A8S9NGZ7_BRACR|nr:hypothetical protein F2Q69_00042439 [Brassica cretica]